MALALRLDQVRELVDACAEVLRLFSAGGDASLGPARASRLYQFAMQTHMVLGENLLGCEDARDEIDRRVHEDDIGAVRERLAALNASLVRVFMQHYAALQIETQMLSRDRIALSDLFMLNIAMLRRVIDLCGAPPPDTFATDFACVRAHGLLAVPEMAEQPIHAYSVHAAMNALHAVYRGTVRVPFSTEFERYAQLVLRRVLVLLTVPGPASVWNVSEYRQATQDHALFRYSSRYLQTVTIVWHALADHFDLAYLLPRVDEPYTVYRPSAAEHERARSWLQRRAGTELDVRVRDDLLHLSLYAGEADLYAQHHRTTQTTHALVLRDHRVEDFYHLTLTAPMPSREVVARQLGARRHELHLALVMLSTLKERIQLAESAVDANAFVVLQPELRLWQTVLTLNPRRPVLVVLYGRVQLWFGGRLLMYNDMLDALCAWMWAVERHCNQRLFDYPVGTLLNDFYRPDETADERIARMATFHGANVPGLGTNGVY